MIIIARSALPSLCAILLSAFIAASAWADPAYRSADFLGRLNPVGTTFKNNLANAGFDNTLFNCGTCFAATPVNGHLIYDSSVPVPVTSTPTNVISIGAIDGVANSTIFELNVGPLQFHFGDAGMLGGPHLQYRNGAFNGFVFAANFLSPNLTPVTFRAEGPTFRLHLASSGTTNLFTGAFNTVLSPGQTGAGFGLMNDQVFAPIPEPQTYALLLTGLGLLGFAARRKRG